MAQTHPAPTADLTQSALAPALASTPTPNRAEKERENFFPTIGSLAENTDRLQLKDQDGEGEKTRVGEKGGEGTAAGVGGGDAEAKADNDDNDDDDDDDRPLQEIESLCMKCHEQGVTRLMLTTIPFFREVVVMSFRCDHCGFSNNEIQSAGTIRPEGTIYTARVLTRADLNRQIVRSPTCQVQLPEFELTLPATLRGQLTTIEGLLRDVVADLAMDQPLRRIQDPAGHAVIEALIARLKEVLGDDEDEDEDEDKGEEEEDGEEDGEERKKRLEQQLGRAAEKDKPMPAFTVKLDDPAGNSFIEFVGSMADPKWNLRTYPRTLQQNIDLGLINPETLAEEQRELAAANSQAGLRESGEGEKEAQAGRTAKVSGDLKNFEPDAIGHEEILVFPGVCSSCGHPLNTLMKSISIPYFKDVLIMSTNCDRCGYRDNEVKSGSAISAKGKLITLKVEDREDLSRDILKSETAGLTIPEIDLVLSHGTLGGRFTTLEGILEQVYEELSDKVFASGDSSQAGDRTNFENFLKGLKEVKSAERPFTVILDDPLANSYVQNIYAPDDDPNMKIEHYERSWEQNEELGLNDIRVEGYEGEKEAAEAAKVAEKEREREQVNAKKAQV